MHVGIKIRCLTNLANSQQFTLIVLSALFAMLNGIGGHPTVYVHSYSGLTFPPWLTNNTIKVSSNLFSTQALD